MLLGQLGSGGMAQVFRAWDSARETHCAVKVMARKLSTKKSIRQRFAREAHAMRKMDHPNVVKVIDVDLEAALPFLVMEIAEGGSLEGWIATHGAMPLQLVLDVVLQVCAGVIAAHDNGIVHRDLKPPNVLIDTNGVCRVSDFGIAQVKDTTNLTGTGHAMGTWLYMPPEQRLNAKEVDHRGDIYNIGVTMYALLTGDAPPDLCLADNDPRVLAVIPEPFRDIVETAVKFLPEDRYQSVRELQEALQELQGTLPPADAPPLAMPSTAIDLDRQILLELNTLLDRPVVSETLVAVEGISETFTIDVDTNPQTVVPSYLDSDDLSESERAHQAGETRIPKVPALPPLPTVSLLRKLLPLLGIGAALAVIPVVAAFIGAGVGMTRVNGAARVAAEAESTLQSAIDDGIIEDLTELGVEPEPLIAARQTCLSSTAPDRYTTFVVALDQAAEPQLGSMDNNDALRVRARTRIRSIHERLADYNASNRSWKKEAGGVTGGLAVSLLLADGPP